jgi:hypothetical protein
MLWYDTSMRPPLPMLSGRAKSTSNCGPYTRCSLTWLQLSRTQTEDLNALSKEVDDLLVRPAPTTVTVGPASEQAEAIAALYKKANDLIERPATVSATAPALESQHLAALTNSVSAVAQQLTSLTARHSTTAAPTKKPTRAAAAAKLTPAPVKPAENVDSAWKPVVSRQTKRRQQIHPPTERCIVLQLAEVPNDAQEAADTALRTIN